MSITSVASLVEVLQNLLQPSQLTTASELASQVQDPQELTTTLVQRGWLTSYQVDLIFKEQAANLVLGKYVLLELLGEGGMGQVFKARDKMLERVVALKVIRQEHLAHDPEAIRRFQREAKAAALLQHPNVVVVYDCDQVGNTYYIAMQYLEGIDLSRLVKEHGPLPIHKACDFVCQAALGLEHAHEHQMVHRDIKPSNLFATFAAPPKLVVSTTASDDPSSAPTVPGGLLAKAKRSGGGPTSVPRYDLEQPAVIKILDMGLVRINRGGERNASLSLTQEGSMVGTPDYIAPEQARNAHRVDIRADLYSLGCTFYYLLTGEPPFTEGSAIEKLLAHQLDEPPPVTQMRPDVPGSLAGIVRKLMAKRPMDRFQTPAEVAEVLKSFAAPSKGPSAPPPPPSAGSAATPSPSITTRQPPTKPPVAIRFGQHATGSYARQEEKKSDDQLAASVFPWAGGSKTPTPTPVPSEAPTLGEAATLLDKRKGHNGCVVAIAFSPDRNTMASGAVDARIFIWDYSAAKPRQRALLGGHQDAIHALAFSPDGSVLASGSGAMDGFIFLWDMRDERPSRLATLSGHQGPVDCLTFSADGKQLASGGGDKTIRLWDISGGYRSRGVLKGHADAVKAIAISPDGNTLASAGADRSIRLWNLGRTLWSKERAILTGHEGPVNALAFAPSGAWLGSVSADQTARLWDVTTVQAKEAMVLAGHDSAIRVLAFAPDSRTVVTAGDGRQVVLWDLTRGEKLREWLLPKAMHSAYCFTADCRYLAVGSSEGPVMVYRLGEKRKTSKSSQGTEKKA